MERVGLEKWRIGMAWKSFSYYDEPRSYYDKEKKEIVLIGMEKKKRGRPRAKKAEDKK